MNTLAPAMKLLCKEGMSQDSPLKIKQALKEIDRDSRRYGWTDERIESLPPEWQHRVACARLQMGCLDWRGWQWRNGRGGHDPFQIPLWKTGVPIYPVQTECVEPERVGRLLIYSEQGIGDMLMFAQALGAVRPYADEVWIDVEPRLAPIFERAFPDFTIHALKDLRDASWVEDGFFDAKVMMGDVVSRFRREKKSFKDLRMVADPEKMEKWKDWLDDKPKVGFTFAGRQGYIDPESLPEEGINLQYGEWEPRDSWITPPIDLKEDLEDVFAITANLDKMISAANTNVHIGAVLGVDTDCILTPGEGQINNAINWRWGMDNTTLWHETVTVYRNFAQWKSRQ